MLDLDLLLVWNVVDDREPRHVRLVEPQERDVAAVGRPPVSAFLAAAVKLFLVNPIEIAVKDRLFAKAPVAGELLFVCLGSINDEKIVAANETDQLAVGREISLKLGVVVARQLFQISCRNVVKPQIARMIEQNAALARVELQPRRVSHRRRVLSLHTIPLQRRRQRRAVKIRHRLPRHRIDPHQTPVHHLLERLPVPRPLHRHRRPPKPHTPRRVRTENVVEREELVLGNDKRRKGKQKKG